MTKMLKIGKIQTQTNQKYQNYTNTDKIYFLKTSLGCFLKLFFVLDLKHWIYMYILESNLEVKFISKVILNLI